MPWQPGQRKATRELEEPYPGVPQHLAGELWAWIGREVERYGLWARTREISMHLRLAAPDSYPVATWRSGATEDSTLDLVEAILELYGAEGQADCESLEDLLAIANSAYRVKEDGSGLEYRVAPSVREAVESTANEATGSAGDHLRNAWNSAYGRNADAVKSYSESIKAVEAAMASRVSPGNQKQTLGTMIRDVAAKPEKWDFVITDGQVTGVAMILHMMRTLWDGQTSRHGGLSPTRPESAEQARAAVHLAAALVQYGTGGSFARRP